MTDEEGHIDFLETQLDLFEKLGRGAIRHGECLFGGRRQGRGLIDLTDRSGRSGTPSPRARGCFRFGGTRRQNSRLNYSAFPVSWISTPRHGVRAVRCRLFLIFSLLRARRWPSLRRTWTSRISTSCRARQRNGADCRCDGSPEDFSEPEPFEQNPAGAATVRARDHADAFSQPSGNMPFERELDFKVGNGLFRKLWVVVAVLDAGLGRAGAALQRALVPALPPQGRARPSARGAGRQRVSMFLRLSVPRRPRRRCREIEALPRLARRRDRRARDPIRSMAASCRTSPCPACRRRRSST